MTNQERTAAATSGVDHESVRVPLTGSTASTTDAGEGSVRTSKYPDVITAEELARQAHISDAEISRDALETLAEVKLHQRLGVADSDPRITDRLDFIAYLHRLTFARVAAPSGRAG